MKKIYRILFTFILIYNFNYSWAHFGTRGGPTGGTVTCFYADNGNNLLYFGTKTGGVYYSRNTTFTGWTYVNYIGLESPYITAITSIGTTTTGVKMVAATPDKGLFVSSDKGITWTATYTGLANTNVTALITKDQYIIAGTGNGEVLISSDSAKTFIKSTSQPGSKINSLITDGNNIYAGTDNGVHISADNGLNWSVAGSGLSGQKVNALIINSGTILAGTNGGVYAATLSGINWSLTNTGLNSTTVTSFAVNGNNIYAGTNNGVFTSCLLYTSDADDN